MCYNIGVARGATRGPGPPNPNTTNDKKIMTTKPSSFFFSNYAHNGNNDNEEALGPLTKTRGALTNIEGAKRQPGGSGACNWKPVDAGAHNWLPGGPRPPTDNQSSRRP